MQSACFCECGIRSQAGSSVVQLAQPNEISDSNINSSASLMRTMRGNCFRKKGHYGSLCRSRALFTKVTGPREFETVHPPPPQTPLCSALLDSDLIPLGQLLSTSLISLIFEELEAGGPNLKCVHVCEWVKRPWRPD